MWESIRERIQLRAQAKKEMKMDWREYFLSGDGVDKEEMSRTLRKD